MTPDVAAYFDTVTSPKRRGDAEALLQLMRRVTGEEPHMWGTIVGFGQYRYRYASGRQGDAPAAGFAARKAALTIYLADGVDAHADLLATLGPHTTGAGCLYLKDLQAVDLAVLENIVERSHAAVTAGTFGDAAHVREKGG